MEPSQRQSLTEIAQELGSSDHPRLQGKVVSASQKDLEGWCATDKFTVVLETADINATELSAYCRERGLSPEQMDRLRQAVQDASAQPLL